MNDSAQTVQGLYAAVGRGDVAALIELLSPDVEWTEAEGFPYGGTYVGPQSVLMNVFGKLATEWDGFAAVPSQFVAQGDTVVALGTYTGVYKATGKALRVPYAHVWTVRDGRVVRFTQFTDTLIVQRCCTN